MGFNTWVNLSKILDSKFLIKFIRSWLRTNTTARWRFCNSMQRPVNLKSHKDSKYFKKLDHRQSKPFIQSSQNIVRLLPYLKEFYFHWNRVSKKSVDMIFKDLSDNNSMKVLDLSWNDLSKSAQAISEFFLKNKSIIHLDLSYSGLDRLSTRILAESLKSNKTILGLHYEGNAGLVDPRGFLQEKGRYEKTGEQRINGIQPVRYKAVNK